MHLIINPSDITGTVLHQGYALNWIIGLKYMPGIKLLLASATPIADAERPLDIIKLLNLLKFSNEPGLFSEGIWRAPLEKKVQDEKSKKINRLEKATMQKYLERNDIYTVYAGLVSYFTLQYDLRVYPKVIDFCPSLQENESTQLIRNDCQALLQSKKHCMLLFTRKAFTCTENKDYISLNQKLRFIPIQIQNIQGKKEGAKKQSLTEVVERWNIITSFIALTKTNQHHYIYSETSTFQGFFQGIKNKQNIYQKFRWYTILNALDNMITLFDFSNDSQKEQEEGGKLINLLHTLNSDEEKINFFVDRFYAKIKVKGTGAEPDIMMLSKREKNTPSVILFAPSINQTNFGIQLRDTKYSNWFAKYMDKPSVDGNAVKTFIFQILLGLFNHKNNINAEYFNIFTGDKSAREGLSLNLLKNVYFLKVPKKISTFIQVVGRGTRFCNFREEKDLSEWRVRPYLLFYNSEDIENFKRLLTAQSDPLDFLQIISLDCYLFGPYIHAPTEQYMCGTKAHVVKKIEELTEIGGKGGGEGKKEEEKKILESVQVCLAKNQGIMFQITNAGVVQIQMWRKIILFYLFLIISMKLMHL